MQSIDEVISTPDKKWTLEERINFIGAFIEMVTAISFHLNDRLTVLDAKVSLLERGLEKITLKKENEKHPN